MSKIYEALLRAELERAIATGRPESTASKSVDELVKPVEEALPLTAAQATVPETAPDLSYLNPPGIDSLTPALDLSRVPQRPWDPLLGALPALTERGVEVEQFRRLRSHLTEFREQAQMRSILVSSGLPGEGKSFIALNLALSFARHKGNRVLLIDGDMRRSSLHRLLGAPREPGLTEYLSGESALLDVMQRPQTTAGPHLPGGLSSLMFIAGGKDADKAGDLAANARFAELMAKVNSTFDWVIIDSSPVNLVSDAVSLSHACDGVLLVAREGVTKYKAAQEAQTQFKSSTVLGFVLNAVHKLPSRNDYYSNYSYDSYRAES